MTIFQSFILGLVQGVAEFLPISSSGFLILIPKIFGWQVKDLAFDAFLHLGSLAAIIFALWPDLKKIWLSIFARKQEREWSRLALWIAVATLPTVICGFALEEIFETTFRSHDIVAYSLIFWGVVLFIVDKFAREKIKAVEKTGLKRALLIGVSQAIALIPGTSRSGITITFGLFAGLSRETAARFSFLLAIPVVAGAGLMKMQDVVLMSGSTGIASFFVGFASTFFAAFFTIKFLLAFLRKYSFANIAIFRVVVGILVLLL